MGTIDYRALRIYCFMLKVSRRKTKKGCILWKGSLNKGGYGGVVKWLQGERLLAHRLSYLIQFGEFNRKLLVCHKCDNPTCVNPFHLFLGTAKDNALDKMRKGRHVKRGKKGRNLELNHCITYNEFKGYQPETINLPGWAL